MHYVRSELDELDDLESTQHSIEDYYNATAKGLLENSYEKLILECKEKEILGSTTALIAIIRVKSLRLVYLTKLGRMMNSALQILVIVAS
jgi:hypothetical protein